MAFEPNAVLNEDEWDVIEEDDEDPPYGPDWDKPMDDPITVAWNITISLEDFEAMEGGFRPRDLSDRWYVRPVPRDDTDDTLILCFARFWSLSTLYSITVKQGDGNAIIESITWEQFEGDNILTEDWAKKEVVQVARDFLECELPGLDALSRDQWWPQYLDHRNNPASSAA